MPQLQSVITVSADFVRPALDGQGLRLHGSTSGYIGISPNSTAGNVDYTLPASDGSDGDVLRTDGSGVMSWVTPQEDHGSLSGLTDDDHSQYPLIAGRAGGQSITGGDGEFNQLILQGSSHASTGYVRLIGSSVIFGATGKVNITGSTLKISGATSGYTTFTPASSGGSIDYTLPSSDGSNGDVLQTDGSGVMSWAAGSGGVTDHGALSGLTDDDHSIYPLLAGRNNTQEVNGGNASGGVLVLNGTSSHTNGTVAIGDGLLSILAGTQKIVAGSGYVPTSDLHLATKEYADTFFLLAGLSGGQIAYGSTASGGGLELRSTSHATKGSIKIGEANVFHVDDANKEVIVKPLFKILGSTSGYVAFQGAAVAGSTTYTLPSLDGSANDVLSTDGSGTLSWAAGGASGITFSADKTASATGAIGEITAFDLASVTADLAFTFPSSPSAGDLCGYIISAQNTSGGTSSTFNDRPFWCVEPVSGTSIEGASYTPKSGEGGNKYSLWITGEKMIFIYTGSTWAIHGDGRKPHVASVTRSSTQSISNASVVDVPYNSDVKDNANLHSISTTTDRVYIKRTGYYITAAAFYWAPNSTGQRFCQIIDNAATVLCRDRRPAQSDSECTVFGTADLTATSYIKNQVYQDSGGSLNIQAAGNFLRIIEQLD